MHAPPRFEDLPGTPLPDLALPASDGREFALRSRVGASALALFFFIRNGTPGWVRELREFRVRHSELSDAGVFVAGVSRDPVERNAEWAARLRLPYPLLSDADGSVGRAFGVMTSIKLGPWSIEFVRRSTVLADADGVVRRVWEHVRVRGHAIEVADAARGLRQGASG